MADWACLVHPSVASTGQHPVTTQAWPLNEWMHYLTSLSQQVWEIDIIIPVLQIRKLRLVDKGTKCHGNTGLINWRAQLHLTLIQTLWGTNENPFCWWGIWESLSFQILESGSKPRISNSDSTFSSGTTLFLRCRIMELKGRNIFIILLLILSIFLSFLLESTACNIHS